MVIISSPLCSMCQNHEETQLHALRDCSWVAAVWKFFINYSYTDIFFNLDSIDWVQWNLKTNAGRASWTSSWSTAFADVVYSIWLLHNEVIHNADTTLPNDPMKLIISRIIGVNYLSLPVDEMGSVVSIKWDVPELGWIKVNFDGVVKLQNMYLGVGGLVRDSTENWVKGFTRCIWQASHLTSELWAIYYGLDQLGIFELLE